jgi:hypothetical protein
LCTHFEPICARLRVRDMGCDSLVDKLLAILDVPTDDNNPSGYNMVRLELAVINDTGVPIINFTNKFEGDGFLAPEVYDAWLQLVDHTNDVIGKNGQPLIPTVRIVASLIAPNNIREQNRLITLNVAKAVDVAEKMERDTTGRFRGTMSIFEGARNVNFKFIKDNTIEALLVAIHSVNYIPLAVPIYDKLVAELDKYKQIADGCDRGMDTWVFWRTYYLVLPTWYKVAAEVALIMVSSAAVERVFSLLTCMFDKQQQRALNDYKEASVRIRYNDNFRNKNFGY